MAQVNEASISPDIRFGMKWINFRHQMYILYQKRGQTRNNCFLKAECKIWKIRFSKN